MDQEKVILKSDKMDSLWAKESIRSIRNRIVFDELGHKVFCVSSLYPKEGVSTIVRLLARSLSDIHKKVIVVSADLKHKDDEAANFTYTLKDYLSDGCTFENIVQIINENSRLIIGSNSEDDYSDLLYLDAFADLITKLKSENDIVLIDSPSFSKASEATILSQLADALILVVKENNIKVHEFSGFYRKLLKQNITIKGVILNRISETAHLEIKAY